MPAGPVPPARERCAGRQTRVRRVLLRLSQPVDHGVPVATATEYAAPLLEQDDLLVVAEFVIVLQIVRHAEEKVRDRDFPLQRFGEDFDSHGEGAAGPREKGVEGDQDLLHQLSDFAVWTWSGIL